MLATVIVSHNRLELLERTLESYRATVTAPHRLVIVDNASDSRTRDFLAQCGERVEFLPENRYPGFATNYGWTLLVDEHTTLLHRSDNDVEYKPGWCNEVLSRFEDASLGQLGLRTLDEEGPHNAVGGNSVIRRALWDAGARYSEQPWGAVAFEDALMSHTVQSHGYRWDRVHSPCIEHLGVADLADPYYQETFRIRGIS